MPSNTNDSTASTWPDNDYFRSWVTSMEQTLGAPIYSHRSLGTPFIEIAPEYDFDCEEIHVGGERLAVAFRHMSMDDEPPDETGHLTEGHQEYYFAKTFKNGIVVYIDPSKVRWADGYEGQASDPLVPICQAFEEWLRAYEPPGPYDGLFEGLKRSRDARVATVRSNLRQHSRELERIHGMQRSQMAEIAKLNRQMRDLQDLDKDKLVAAIGQYEGLVRANGALEMSYASLNYTIPEFELHDPEYGDDVPIGPLVITLTLEDYSLSVDTLANRSIDGYPHPHVSAGGHICWGGRENGTLPLYEQVANGFNPFELLFFTANFLRTVYTDNDAHQRLADWGGRERGWWCEYCEADHPSGEGCPNECVECDNHVDWDYHQTCRQHGCWNEDDYDECPVCTEEREQAEREQEEREALEAEAEREQEEREALEAEAEREQREQEAVDAEAAAE